MVLDPEMLKAYQKRWRAVAEIENAQRQQTSPSQRWQKMNSLFRMAVALELQPMSTDQEMEMEIYKRWNQLRAAYLSQQEE